MILLEINEKINILAIQQSLGHCISELRLGKGTYADWLNQAQGILEGSANPDSEGVILELTRICQDIQNAMDRLDSYKRQLDTYR